MTPQQLKALCESSITINIEDLENIVLTVPLAKVLEMCPKITKDGAAEPTATFFLRGDAADFAKYFDGERRAARLAKEARALAAGVWNGMQTSREARGV